MINLTIAEIGNLIFMFGCGYWASTILFTRSFRNFLSKLDPKTLSNIERDLNI